MNKFHLIYISEGIILFFEQLLSCGLLYLNTALNRDTFRISPEQMSQANLLFLLKVNQYVVKCKQNLFYWQFRRLLVKR